MEDRISKLPVGVQRILKNQDSVIGFIVVWYLAFTVFPAGGFFLGTIVSPASNYKPAGDAPVIRHYWDLHAADIYFGVMFAGIGLLIGICFGIFITFIYPKLKEADALEDAETAHRLHEMLSHHEVIATDMGQTPEHSE